MQQCKKICNLCHQKLDFEHFTLNAANKDGRDSRCRDCSHSIYAIEIASRRTAEQIQKTLRRTLLETEGKKECKVCHAIKNLTEFRPGKLTCRECLNKKQREDRFPKLAENSAKARIKYYADPVKPLFFGCRNRARRGGLEFNLSLEYLQNLWQRGDGKCTLSGIPFAIDNSQSKFSKSPYRPSLDRIDNNRGYIVGNVRFVLWGLNLSINEYGFAIYLHIAQEVVRRNGDPFACI
jgi:hypothetical protein